MKSIFLFLAFSIVTLQTQAACPAPTVVSVTQITANQARVSWQSVSGASAYELGWRKSGVTAWQTVSVASAVGNILGALVPNTAYEVRVRVNCGGTFSGYSPTRKFTTLCGAPNKPTVTDVSINTALVKWNAIPGVSEYQIAWRIVGQPWKTQLTPNISRVLSSLCQQSNYEVQISANCGGEFTEYSPLRAFKTLAPRMGESKTAVLSSALSLYPNPSNGTFTLDFESENETNGRLFVWDMNGRLVQTEEIAVTTGQNLFAVELFDLRAGIYQVSLETSNAVYRTRAVVVK